ncbi:Uncharacterised protein [Halioglobus japonicus]|nr:Uncharacterised protein [Halioglobus japonicus]
MLGEYSDHFELILVAGTIQIGFVGVFIGMYSYQSGTFSRPRRFFSGGNRRAAVFRWSMYYLRMALALCTLFVLMHKAHAGALFAQTIGQAYDQESNELLYSEVHCVSQDALAREVVYRDSQEQLVAYKVLNYTTGSLTPSFVQDNVASNDVVAVQLEQGGIILTTTAGESAPEMVALKPGGDYPVVVDAGFDAFVRQNWDSLIAGESMRFQFPVAAREALVTLSIESTPCSYATGTDQCFRLEPDNWLFRMLADHIELGYDADLQRLARFRGVSNISDGSDSGLAVDIHYRYYDLADLQCDRP